jgi:MFS family permease
MLRIPPALKNPRYRAFWFGLMISQAGSQMQLWALFWHIRELTDQPIAIGIVGLVRFLPILFFSLIGGLAADRFNRRTILFITQTTMAIVAALLAWLTWIGQIQLWHIYALTGIQAVAVAFDLPARQAMTPNLLERKDLANAFSLGSIAFNTGAIVGPALSGIVIANLGQEWTYTINAVSFLAVIYALIIIGPVTQTVDPKSMEEKGLSAIRAGIRFIASQPIILSSMILDFFATFFSSANTLLPYVARDILKVGAIEYGWLSSAQAVGSVGAGLFFSQRTEIRRQGFLLIASVGAFGLATILFGLSTSFWLAMISLILIGAADSVSTIIRNTVRQLQTPDALRGRMTSINQIFFMGGPQLGEIEAGAIAQAFGVPISILSGGIGCILAAILIGRGWPQLRNYNGDEPALAKASAD